MATESSAIVRFISAAQQEHHTLEDGSAAVPDLTDDLDDLKPIRRSYRLPVVVLAALTFAAVAAAVGVYVGKNYFTDSQETSEPAAPPAAAAVAPAAAPPADAAVEAVAAPMPGTPALAAAPAPSPPPAAAPAPPAAALTPQVLAATGFDIRVKPQATITLDGRVLGKSPLRVRNLTPGAHVVDVEAPAGFFSRRVEIELSAGEPQNVNLALDPIDASDANEASDAAEDKRGAKKAKKAKAKSRSAKARRARRHARNKERRKRARAMEAEIAEAVALPDGAASTRPADGTATGTLMIGSKPPCDIYIDGEPTGLKTPQRAIEVAAGTHRVTLINAELDIKKSFTVKISAGKSTRAIHDLTGKM